MGDFETIMSVYINFFYVLRTMGFLGQKINYFEKV